LQLRHNDQGSTGQQGKSKKKLRQSVGWPLHSPFPFCSQGQTKKASDTHYKDKVPEEDMPSERTSASNKATVASRRNRERQKIGVSGLREETQRTLGDIFVSPRQEEETSRMTEDVQDSKNVDPKKDHHTKAVPQPTTEQVGGPESKQRSPLSLFPRCICS